LGIKKNEDSATWQLPTGETVEAFNLTADNSIGPKIASLQIDWNVQGISPWTKRAGVVFSANFVLEYHLGSFPNLSLLPDAGVIAQIFIGYMHSLKKMYQGRSELSDKRESQKSRWRKRLRRSRVSSIAFSGSAWIHSGLISFYSALGSS
jgi:hypothetical protein